MGLLWKSREEREHEQKVAEREQYDQQRIKESQENDRRWKVLADKAAAWGLPAEDRYFCEVETFEARGRLSSIYDLFRDAQTFNARVAERHRDYPALVLYLLEAGSHRTENDSWRSVAVENSYSFQEGPCTFRLIKATLLETLKEPTDCRARLLLAIGGLTAADQVRAKTSILAAGKGDVPFNTMFVICREYDWLDDYEQVLREKDDFYGVLMLLAFRKDWDSVLEWLEAHHKYKECVSVLESAGRFQDAASRLKKLGPRVWGDKDLYNEVIERLTALVTATDPSNGAPDPEELEDKLAYGEITRAEYERKKSTPNEPSTQTTCRSCGKATSSKYMFCPHCGSRVDKAAQVVRTRQVRSGKPPPIKPPLLK